MREITITSNDAGRRLDRFLRKYLKDASLGDIYKFIRKDVKVDGKRRGESYMLSEGQVLTLYIADDVLDKLIGTSNEPGRAASKRTFEIVYEDDQILIANKPYGLLTHGDVHEKKNHLANQVKDYLIAKGEYNPREEKVFTPAPVNRLDRNTTGLVLFGKTAESMRELTRMIREDEIRKYYLTMASGIIEDRLHLKGSLIKDERSNKVRVLHEPADKVSSAGAIEKAKDIETIVLPLEYAEFGQGFKATLCEVELVTGRTHQIRAHLADAGHPILGDSKYADKESRKANAYCKDVAGLSTQLLHAFRIEFKDDVSTYEALGYLAGQSFKSPMPRRFSEIFWKLWC